jgi:hypothetical protein
VELRLRPVVVVGGVQRANEGDVVHAAGQVRPPVAELDAAPAVLAEADLEREEAVTLLAVGVVEDDDAGQPQPLGILDVAERRLGDGQAGVAVEGRLGVEALQVADAAIHEQPDHALGFGREVRAAVGRRPAALGAVAVAVQHGGQRQAGEAHAQVGEESPAVNTTAGALGCGRRLHVWNLFSPSF